jgi:hypothetical protein
MKCKTCGEMHWLPSSKHCAEHTSVTDAVNIINGLIAQKCECYYEDQCVRCVNILELLNTHDEEILCHRV